MLFEAQQISQLAAYVKEMHDPELLRWWGKYNESLGHFDTALESYQQANDTVAVVQLHCHQEDFVAACTAVEQSDNAAAAFMLARQLEATEQVCNLLHCNLQLSLICAYLLPKHRKPSHGSPATCSSIPLWREV